MTAAEVDVIRWGRERARTGPWRGDRGVAFLSPLPDAPIPSAAFVRRCLDVLAARGYARVVTGALSPGETEGFLGAGFEVQEHLHLLAHDLRTVPTPPHARLRRGTDDDVKAVLAVDHASFSPFWRLDEPGLADTLVATPRSRFRVAEDVGGDIVGYVVTGRSGRAGYVQRLAVDPGRRREGLGRALVIDGLRWLRRWRVTVAYVNTQLQNTGALALYESLGFRREPAGLTVLAADCAG